jgi:hypothetical protein
MTVVNTYFYTVVDTQWGCHTLKKSIAEYDIYPTFRVNQLDTNVEFYAGARRTSEPVQSVNNTLFAVSSARPPNTSLQQFLWFTAHTTAKTNTNGSVYSNNNNNNLLFSLYKAFFTLL